MKLKIEMFYETQSIVEAKAVCNLLNAIHREPRFFVTDHKDSGKPDWYYKVMGIEVSDEVFTYLQTQLKEEWEA